ncbi:MAG: hypothetical protein WCG35_07735 [Betaproteobacteria bacterium]
MKFPFLVALLFLLNGCGQYDIRNIDKPPPEDYETWKKPSNSQLDIKMALLGCGAIAPSTLGWPYRKVYEKIGIVEQYDQFNHDFLVDRCMINAGFIQQNTSWTLQDACADKRYRDYPACQPDAVIPTPSVERRLNSWYCKVKSDYSYCLKYSLNPTACSPEDARHLPPECLPVGQAASQTDSTIQNERKSSIYVAPSRAQQQATDIQRETQNQNNRQMNNMLKSTTLKTR